jgi:hypothetical protein
MRSTTNSDTDNIEIERLVGEYARELFGINADGSYKNTFEKLDPATGEAKLVNGNILEDMLTNTEVLKDPSKGFIIENMSDAPLYRIYINDENGVRDFVDISPKMAQLYVAATYKNLEKYGSALSDLVNVCKIDTKKQGKNFIEQSAYLEKYKRVFEDKEGFFEPEGLAALQGKNGESFIDKKTMNSISLFKDILS